MATNFYLDQFEIFFYTKNVFKFFVPLSICLLSSLPFPSIFHQWQLISNTIDFYSFLLQLGDQMYNILKPCRKPYVIPVIPINDLISTIVWGLIHSIISLIFPGLTTTLSFEINCPNHVLMIGINHIYWVWKTIGDPTTLEIQPWGLLFSPPQCLSTPKYRQSKPTQTYPKTY